MQKVRERWESYLEADMHSLLTDLVNSDKVAGRILEKYNPAQLVNVSVADLTQIPDVGPVMAKRIHAAIKFGRKLFEPKVQGVKVTNPGIVSDYLLAKIGNEDKECFVVILLDTKNRVMDAITLYRGTLNASMVRVAEVFKDAITQNACSIIIAHNHPSGDVTPSPEDLEVTRKIEHAAIMLDIQLLDHLIVGRGNWKSLRNCGHITT